MFLTFVFFFFFYHWTSAQDENYVYEKHPTFLACPALTIDKDVIITSPLFPEYAPYFYCEYVMKAPEGKQVEVTFTEFHLPRRSHILAKSASKVAQLCEDNFLEVKARNITQKGIRYCGTELSKKKIISERSTLILTFQSMPFDAEAVKGFKATVEFKSREPDDTHYPCGGAIISTDANFVVDTSALPCKIRIGAPATAGGVGLMLKSNLTECLFKVEFKPNRPRMYVCNSILPIQASTNEIIIHEIPEETSMDAELVFSERTDRDFVTCGGVMNLELETLTEMSLDLDNGPSVRCLWIIETPRSTRAITLRANSVAPAANFHLFHMIVSPSSLKYEIMLNELEAKTYRNNHLYTSLPKDPYIYKFDQLETESKVLMVLLFIDEGGPKKFNGSVIALPEERKMRLV